MQPILGMGPFNNYVDQIWPNIDPHPPRVDKHGHFTYPTLCPRGQNVENWEYFVVKLKLIVVGSPLVPLGSLWFPLAPLGSPWLALVPLGSLWFPLAPLDSPWFPLDLLRSHWISLDTLWSHFISLYLWNSSFKYNHTRLCFLMSCIMLMSRVPTLSHV